MLVLHMMDMACVEGKKTRTINGILMVIKIVSFTIMKKD